MSRRNCSTSIAGVVLTSNLKMWRNNVRANWQAKSIWQHSLIGPSGIPTGYYQFFLWIWVIVCQIGMTIRQRRRRRRRRAMILRNIYDDVFEYTTYWDDFRRAKLRVMHPHGVILWFIQRGGIKGMCDKNYGNYDENHDSSRSKSKTPLGDWFSASSPL